MPPEHSPTASTPSARVLTKPVRWLLLALALVCLALGIIGLFVPVLPTVPFVLLAAWAAGHSSPRLSQWLEQHPRWGAPLRQWRQAGAVSRRAKWSATLAMTASAVVTAVLLRPHWAALATIAVMACVLVWLWRRPEQAAPQA